MNPAFRVRHLGDKIAAAKRPVTLHIYLANSLLVPRGTAGLFESNFKIAVDNKDYVLNINGIEGAEDFDALITFCDDIVERYKDQIDRPRFKRLLESAIPGRHSKDLPSQVYDVYAGMKTARIEGRNSIWKFILQNSYKPVFLMNRFDFVVGNPPWLTYSGVSNGEYQNLLRQLSDGYSVTPQSRANMPHLEIAAIFLAHAINYFLKPNGRLAFVLPRSFLSADQHDNTRGGIIEGVRLQQAWDLKGVSPLFRVPCCVLFAVRTSDDQAQRQIPPGGIPGLSMSGRLPRSQIHWVEASPKLTQKKTRWHYSKLQSTKKAARSALTEGSMEALVGSNAYAAKFSQGATIVPRNFYFVEIGPTKKSSEELRDSVVSVKTSKASEREAKTPWKIEKLAGRVEGGLLFRTAISRNIIPFAIVDPLLVVLPVVEQGADGKTSFKCLTGEELLENRFRFASSWFSEAEDRWEAKKTDKNKRSGMTLSDRLNFQSGLTNQNPRARYLVLYTSSATDASAAVVDRRGFDHPFIVDHKAYWCECSTLQEAHYLSAYVNSGYANGMIKEFQSQGLFGPRDIHKLILKIPFPKFQKDNADHKLLATLGAKCAKFAASFVENTDTDDLQARALGRVRARLDDQLADELDQIDALVEKLSTGKAESGRVVRIKRRRSSSGRSLFD